jgi:hypothetical protein
MHGIHGIKMIVDDGELHSTTGMFQLKRILEGYKG